MGEIVILATMVSDGWCLGAADMVAKVRRKSECN